MGSWRDHPPTGVDVDLSVPHAEPPPRKDDDDEDDDDRRREVGGFRCPARGMSQRRCGATLGLATECAGCALGSNNWVIAGKHTASGKPLLANDMHIGLTEPNIWYMADAAGAGL